ncbi:MAG: 3-dehydroquinate synthase [Armatimonadetes bacterium]|nr:3-dehydroquinate synthase [Armatimonadota bacterium]
MKIWEHAIQAGDLSARYRLGSGLLARAGTSLTRHGIGRCIVITDENVAARHRPALEAGLGELARGWIVVPPGEQQKSLDGARALYDQLVRLGCDRRTAVIAFGGGVIGDLAGFAAATFLRGVPLLQLPTTLLAMVDSSIGGKVGVDLPQGKNLVGAFYAPLEILADVGTLATLPRREWSGGMAEVIKHAVIASADFFEELERAGTDPAAWTPEELARRVHRAAGVKVGVVGRDPREQGERAHLNFGHTLGHALEAAGGYAGLSHGEAVALGMLAALRLSRRQGRLEADFEERLRSLLVRWNLPVRLPPLPWEAVAGALARDKKNLGSKLTFVIPRALGRVEVERGLEVSEVEAIFRELSG